MKVTPLSQPLPVLRLGAVTLLGLSGPSSTDGQ